jgi:hypothetical protein
MEEKRGAEKKFFKKERARERKREREREREKGVCQSRFEPVRAGALCYVGNRYLADWKPMLYTMIIPESTYPGKREVSHILRVLQREREREDLIAWIDRSRRRVARWSDSIFVWTDRISFFRHFHFVRE